MGVKVLSLFDGMACGMLAMQRVGIAVDEYTAYEIDKYAIQTAKHNFPMIQECGDVFTADFTQYKDIDYIVGGSPCTFWSCAQMNNRETKASGLGWELFSQYVRAIREVKPVYFIYENNKSMSSAIRDSITKTFGFEPICINSALVSAQHRQRLYWVGRRNADGTYSKVAVEQPQDKGIRLADVVDAQVECVNTTAIGKAQCLRATCYKDGIRNLVGNTVDRRTCIAERVCVLKDTVPVEAQSCVDGKTYTVYAVKNKLITIKDKLYPMDLSDGYYIIRKLTVTECKRLQTVPDWYTFPVSNTNAYKMLGNGWTVDVIAHILSYMPVGTVAEVKT